MSATQLYVAQTCRSSEGDRRSRLTKDSAKPPNGILGRREKENCRQGRIEDSFGGHVAPLTMGTTIALGPVRQIRLSALCARSLGRYSVSSRSLCLAWVRSQILRGCVLIGESEGKPFAERKLSVDFLFDFIFRFLTKRSTIGSIRGVNNRHQMAILLLLVVNWLVSLRIE